MPLRNSQKMKTYLFTHPEKITQQQLEQELLPQLPEWRREQALKFKFLSGQVLCAKAFLLLKEGLEKDFGISGPITFQYLEHEKPVLKEHPNVHFNFSHCKNGVFCVIDDKNEVGCDIEIVDRGISDALLRRCCNDVELSKIKNAVDSNIEFIKLWTVKEAVLKCIGVGLVDDLPDLLTSELLGSVEVCTRVYEDLGFVCSTCKAKAK